MMASFLTGTCPGMDGLTLLRKLRQAGSSTRVLILSGRREVADRVAGLQAGADDYLIKPFSFQELLARMQNLLRRAQETSETLTVGDLVLDPQRHTVVRAGKPIKLSQREYALLEYLMRNAGRTVTRTMVVEHVWNLWFDGLTSVVDVYISYLRAKVDHGFSQPLIHTMRGVGFTLSTDPKSEKKSPANSAILQRGCDVRLDLFSIQQKSHRAQKVGAVGPNLAGFAIAPALLAADAQTSCDSPQRSRQSADARLPAAQAWWRLRCHGAQFSGDRPRRLRGHKALHLFFQVACQKSAGLAITNQ